MQQYEQERNMYLITDVERHNITNYYVIYRDLNSSATSNNLCLRIFR